MPAFNELIFNLVEIIVELYHVATNINRFRIIFVCIKKNNIQIYANLIT